MSISFPRLDIMDLASVKSAKLWARSRQEISRRAGGPAQGKDMGSPIWGAKFTSRTMDLDDLMDLETALMSLHGVINKFEVHDPRRPYPKAHRDGTFLDNATLSAVGGNNKDITLSGMPTGFILSTTDYFCFDYGTPSTRAFHRIDQGGVFDTGQNCDVSVFPHIRPGWTAGTAVRLEKPSFLAVREPGDIEPQYEGLTAGSISFTAVQWI